MQCAVCWRDEFECCCVRGQTRQQKREDVHTGEVEDVCSEEVVADSLFSNFSFDTQPVSCAVQNVCVPPFWGVERSLHELPIWNPYEVSEGLQQERHPSVHPYISGHTQHQNLCS